MVSSRDCYMFVSGMEFPPEKSNSGKKEYTIACKSKDLPQYPPKPDCVRIKAYLVGLHLVEVEPGLCELHHYSETDMKITMFVAKHTIP